MHYLVRHYIPLLCFVLLTINSFAVTKTFNGSVDSSWNVAANWTPSGVPVSTDDVILDEDVFFGTNNITIADLSITSTTKIDGDGTFTFENLSISNNKTLTINKNVIPTQGTSFTCTFGAKSHMTIKHNVSSTTATFGTINLGNFSRLLWTTSRGATIEDLNLADYNVVEFSNGTTTFGTAQDWTEDCNTAAILRSRLAGNDADLVFTGTGNVGEFNVYEDLDGSGSTMDISNSKIFNIAGTFSGGSSVSTTIVSAGSGDFNDGATWVGGCTPKHLDSVVVLNTHVIDIPAQYYARVDHLYIEGTGEIDGPNSGVLEIEGNLRVNSDSCFKSFTGITEFRSLNDAIMINLSGTTIKFGGPVRKEIGGTTLSIMDTVWFESTANGRGDITITRGTMDFGAYNVYLENDLNVPNNGFLVPGTSKWIAKGTAGQITTLDIDGTGHLYHLVLDKENDVDYIELQSDIEIEDSLTLLTGICQSSNSSTLIFRDGANTSIGDINSFVDGPIQKIGDEAFVFPLGDETGGSTYFASLGISAPTTSTDAYTAEYFFSLPTNNLSFASGLAIVSYLEYWDLSQDAGSSTLNLSLDWGSQSGTITDASEMRVSHYNSGSSEWENMGNTATGGTLGDGFVTSASVSSFSPFTLSSTTNLNAIPVHFVEVSATNVGSNSNLIEWTTATEINNAGFEVQKQNGNAGFETLGFISSEGNSINLKHYNFMDDRAHSGMNVYRIKQLDFDEKYAYSEVVRVNLSSDDDLVIYPNPTKGKFEISNLNEGSSIIKLMNSNGLEIYSQKTSDTSFTLDISKLNKGIYWVNVIGESISHTQMIVVK